MKKKRSTYLERRKQQLLDDNAKEDKDIKRLKHKLGLDRRKPRKSGGEKQPAWMKESGLDFLIDYEKCDEISVDGDSKKIVLGEANQIKETRKDIYGQNPGEMNESDCSIEEMSIDSLKQTDLDENVLFGKIEKTVEAVSSVSKNVNSDSEILTLRRDVRRLLNCLSESQMSKTISGLVGLFSDRPRATVRQVLIEEIDNLLESFPISRGQCVGWLQQELAVCFVSAQGRLDHSGQDSRLVAYFVEFLINKVSNETNDIENVGVLTSQCVFISYLYRFGALTGDLVMDLVEEFVHSAELSSFQIAHQMINPVSSSLRKEQLDRCISLVGRIKDIIPSLDQSDFEKIVELEGISSKLATKHSNEPALSSSIHFVKMMRSWNKGISFPSESRLPLRLEELRNAKDKGRWWAVGSAFSGDALMDDSSLNLPQKNPVLSKYAFSLSPELQEIATRLGLVSPIRQHLFGVLVSTPGGPNPTAEALIRVCSRQAGNKHQGTDEHREQEMVQIVMHCLVSEQPFNRFYTRVLGALLNHHRRFGIMIRCAFWDVMSKDELTKEAKRNAGRAIAILTSVFSFPLTLLKKFNFGDESEANVALLSAVVEELTQTSFKSTIEKFAYVANGNPRVGRNLRVFMRKMSKSHPDEACRSYLTRLVTDLRNLFP